MDKYKCIFIDRDGVINYRPVADYVKTISEFKLIPDVPDFLNYIKSKNYLIIIISNQQGVGKGLMTKDQLDEITDFLQQQIFQQTKYKFDDIFYCTDLKDSSSFNRKPNPGMILDAVNKWKIDTFNSWMIGDSESDIIAGKRAGVRTVLIKPDFINIQSECDFQFKNLKQLIDSDLL